MSEKVKKTLIWIVLILLILVHVPVPSWNTDGGTFRLSALAWRYTHYHIIADDTLKALYEQKENWESELSARWDRYYTDGFLERAVFQYFPSNLTEKGVLDP